MKIGAKSTTGWRATISVAMANYIEAGSIIAIATSLTYWQDEFGITDFAVGLLAALSSNAFGAAPRNRFGGPCHLNRSPRTMFHAGSARSTHRLKMPALKAASVRAR